MRVRWQRPANDNGTPVAFPVFPELLNRHDLTQTDVLAYGALLALTIGGRSARVADLAAMLGKRHGGKHLRLRASIRKLEAAQLLRREFVDGKATHYVPLGPIAACG